MCNRTDHPCNSFSPCSGLGGHADQQSRGLYIGRHLDIVTNEGLQQTIPNIIKAPWRATLVIMCGRSVPVRIIRSYIVRHTEAKA